MKPSILAIAGLLVCGCASAAPPPTPRPESVASASTARPYDPAAILEDCRRRGAEDAEKAIAAGEARVFFFGLPLPDYEFFDGETGLPATTYGCTITVTGRTYVRAWNETVRGACREGRIRANPPP